MILVVLLTKGGQSSLLVLAVVINKQQ